MAHLDLADIQGNIQRPYGRYGFPYNRHLFFNIAEPEAGRLFVDAIRPFVTTAEPWDSAVGQDGAVLVHKPPIALNIGFTWAGLAAVGLPTRTLRLFPDEFIDGMGARAEILGDLGSSAPRGWDPIWRPPPPGEPHKPVHVWLSLNAGALPDSSPRPELAAMTGWLEGLVEASRGKVTLLPGHGPGGQNRWQDSSARWEEAPGVGYVPTAKEHFGFTDGISDPIFLGQYAVAAETVAAVGGGKIAEGPYDPARSWAPLETGEFILGLPDEGQELPVATMPAGFVANGSFMVWRKLREDVEAFEQAMKTQAAVYGRVAGMADETEALETLYAKVVGRWRSGVPLMAAPTWSEQTTLLEQWSDIPALRLKPARTPAENARLDDWSRLLTGFRYGDDPDGARCPLGAHIRRGNPRDMLDPKLSATLGSSTLTKRRRLIRRGLPYETDGEKGVIFMAHCASLFRQFEFIQQQWMQYGLDFESGNDTCPLVGSRRDSDKFVVPAGAANDTPFIASGLPRFVDTRGGDYFFVPSLSALRQIAMGTVDPT